MLHVQHNCKIKQLTLFIKKRTKGLEGINKKYYTKQKIMLVQFNNSSVAFYVQVWSFPTLLLVNEIRLRNVRACMSMQFEYEMNFYYKI